MILDLARVFCQNTSIRGVGKIFKAPSAYLRALWLIYVLAMLVFLVHSTTRLLKDYLEYSTVIQTSGDLADASEFPSLTFCNHYPFSERGKELWRTGKVMSPKKWNRFLRGRLRQCVNKGQIDCALNSFLDDTKRMYYQNLKPNESVKIGHSLNNSILLCVSFQGSSLNVGTPTECGIKVEPISLVNYFNCFTVRPSGILGANRLVLVINVREKPDFGNQEQAFITDIFEQAQGVRMVVHEPGTYPDIDGRGDQVEPGKMVQVSYYPINVKEEKTPKKPCYVNNKEYPMIQDLDKTYNYSFEACMSMHANLNYVSKCKCYFADNLRPGVPNETHPYCGEIRKTSPKDFGERRKCVSVERQRLAMMTNDDFKCYKRCTYFRYKTRTSITKWRPTHWQVYWARSQLRALNILYDMYQSKNKSELQDNLSELATINDYVDSKNLTKVSEAPNLSSSIPTNADDFVYIVLSRQDAKMMQEVNKLTLTLNGFISRVGGLCSLYLGLTCAFGVELIEFLYLIKQKYSKSKSKTVSENEDSPKQEVENPVTSNVNNNVSREPMLGIPDSPVYGMTAYLCDDNKIDEDSPWQPRVPANSTPL